VKAHPRNLGLLESHHNQRSSPIAASHTSAAEYIISQTEWHWCQLVPGTPSYHCERFCLFITQMSASFTVVLIYCRPTGTITV